MKRLLTRLLVAGAASVLGALAGSALRQLVLQKTSPETRELVISATPIPIVAGTVAGTLLPRGGPYLAFVVAANVAANTTTAADT